MVKAATVGQGSKTALVITLLKKSNGASLAELMKATGWQAHSVRGFLSGTLRKKMGLKVQSAKRGDREAFTRSLAQGKSDRQATGGRGRFEPRSLTERLRVRDLFAEPNEFHFELLLPFG
jgi:hypothetical protein